jgi:hypothetical protein
MILVQCRSRRLAPLIRRLANRNSRSSIRSINREVCFRVKPADLRPSSRVSESTPHDRSLRGETAWRSQRTAAGLANVQSHDGRHTARTRLILSSLPCQGQRPASVVTGAATLTRGAEFSGFSRRPGRAVERESHIRVSVLAIGQIVGSNDSWVRRCTVRSLCSYIRARTAATTQ